MAITLNRSQRDAVRDHLITELGTAGDLPMLLGQGAYPAAQRLGRRVRDCLGFLDDLGWAESDPREAFELTMPLDQLERTMRELRHGVAGSLSEHVRESYENADTAYRDAVACDAYADVFAQIANAEENNEKADTEEWPATECGDIVAARTAGAVFAREWGHRQSAQALATVLDGFPTLPEEVDRELLEAAEAELGSLRGRPDLKAELRGAFWFALRAGGRARGIR